MTSSTRAIRRKQPRDDGVAVHILAPKATAVRKRRWVCQTCRKRTTFLAESFEWYGTTSTCLKCGDQWSDGERRERPFCPGWRPASVTAARKRWGKWKARARA